MSEEGLKQLCDYARTPSEALGLKVEETEKKADERAPRADRGAEPDLHHAI